MFTGTGPGAVPGATAIASIDVAWALAVAGAVWLLGWLTLVLAGRERRPRSKEHSAPPTMLGPAPPGTNGTPQTEHVAGILRWLLAETEADGAAFLSLVPGGGERVLVEPRGLDPASVAALARAGREALVRPDQSPPSGLSAVRWLGSGGSKGLILKGVPRGSADEPLRFARFAIESGSAIFSATDDRRIEERVRSVPGVAWAELAPDDPSEVRVMLAEGAERRAMEADVVAAAGPKTHVRWVSAAEAEGGPRARLVGAAVTLNGRADAEVQIDWRGQPLRGRGHAGPSPTGRYRASAEAMTDALGPLLAGEVRVEGLYVHTHGEGELVVVVVSVDDERLVGAVQARQADQDATAARAVLDAVNRRLTLIAGGSGRI